MCTGYKTAHDHVKYLGGSEDTLVTRVYARYSWYEDTKYQVEVDKFVNFKKHYPRKI